MIKIRIVIVVLAILLLIGSMLTSCTSGSSTTETASEEKTTAEPEWIVLFDGTSTDGWRGYNMDSLPPNWIIEEGTLKSLGTGGDIGGDIIYGAKEFANFELELDWKISEGGNSGIFYHVIEDTIYRAPYETAPEYQLIDNIGYPGKLEDWQMVGADYAMYPADSTKDVVKPANEWNTTRILFSEEKAEYWLNGEKVVEFVPWSDDWLERRNSGKWDQFPDYAKAKSGFIGVQDHGSFIWFRNIRIKEL